MFTLFHDTQFIHKLWFACISAYLFAMPLIELVALYGIACTFREISKIRHSLEEMRDSETLTATEQADFEEWLDTKHNKEKQPLYRFGQYPNASISVDS